MKTLVRLICLSLFLGITAQLQAQDPGEWTIHVSPLYVGATANDEFGFSSFNTGDYGVSPSAFFVEITDLEPNTVYEVWQTGAFGLLRYETTATRGSYWRTDCDPDEEECWVSPSTVSEFAVSDAEGRIARWLYIRPPSGFGLCVSEEEECYRVRLRIRQVGAEQFITFDDQSPYNVQALPPHDEAPEGAEGALITGYAHEMNEGYVVLAYENAGDARPLQAWLIGSDPAARTRSFEPDMPGYFQLVVPANTDIGLLEVRDENGQILRQQFSGAWRSGDAGSIVVLNDLDDVRLTSWENLSAEVPEGFDLGQNYPNPFNPVTRFEFSLPRVSHATVKVYNMLGQQVATLFNETIPAGTHIARWDGRDEKGVAVPSGVYFYTLQADGFSQSKKMILLK